MRFRPKKLAEIIGDVKNDFGPPGRRGLEMFVKWVAVKETPTEGGAGEGDVN